MAIKTEILYPSNLITLSRLLILIITIFLLLNNRLKAAAIFILLIWISDILDGYIARKRNEITYTGKIIDPLIDKIAIVSLSIILLLKNLIPFWFLFVLIFREILILTGGMYLKKNKNLVLPSNFAGKLSAFIIGLTIFYTVILAGFGRKYPFSEYLLLWELISNVLIFISLVMVLTSLIVYFKRFLEVTKN